MLISRHSASLVVRSILSALALAVCVALFCTPALADEPSDSVDTGVALSAISYRSHLSNVGWGSLVDGGVESGNHLGSNPVECVELMADCDEESVKLAGKFLICGEAEFQYVSSENTLSFGTTGRSEHLNAVAIDAPTDGTNFYDIYYRVYLERYGWLEWASNGELSGSNDPSLKVYAIQIVIAQSGEDAPLVEDSTAGTSYVEISDLISYSAHVQDLGWLPSVTEGSVAGTTGRGLRMEALRVSLGSSAAAGSVEMRAHVSDLGWQDWSEGSCGTTGAGHALEAVCIRLTGEAADTYDVWYRVHSAEFGWLGWAKDGEEAGSEGFGRAAQAVEVRLLPKGSDAPGDTSGAYINKAGQNLKFKVMYGDTEIKKTLGSDGAYCYSLPAVASAEDVSVTYASGSYVSVTLGYAETLTSKGEEVTLSDCGLELGDPSGVTLPVKVGYAVVGTLVFAKSSNIATLSIASSDPVNYGRAYIESSKSHSTNGSISLTDADGTIVYDGGLDQIKGRGNTTWSASKKPYQIKLSKKADLLESSSKANKSKTWVLLANAYDKTGLRNLTAYNLAISIGVSSAVESRMVDLYYDGEYRGTYQLCEKVQINSGRVDITNLEDEIDDLNEDVESLPRATAKNKYGNTFQYTKDVVNPDDITGGYLIEYDPVRYTQEASWFTVKMGSQTVAFVCKNPEYWSYEQAIYLSEYFQEAFDSINAGGLNRSTGKTSLDYFDKDAVASLYWLNELTLNRDGLAYSSTFIYKDRDASGSSKLVFGPGWDFDLSLGNDAMIENPNFVNYNWWYTRSVAGLGSFLYSDYHLKRAIDDYRGVAVNSARDYLVDGEYDQAASDLSSSLVLNSRLWGSNTSAGSLKTWFLNRLDWMRSQY